MGKIENPERNLVAKGRKVNILMWISILPEENTLREDFFIRRPLSLWGSV